jgi:hypothetical protein
MNGISTRWIVGVLVVAAVIAAIVLLVIYGGDGTGGY